MTGAAPVPAEISIRPDRIPSYRQRRPKTTFQGCTQVNQIFVKADGKISCSCQRYYHILEDARNINVAEWYNGQIMSYIRDSFKEKCEPFSFCTDCVSHIAEMNVDEAKNNLTLHVEPSSQCNLFCSACTCTNERLASNTPPRANLSPAVFSKIVHEFAASETTIGTLAFVGYGEPLFNSNLPDMARLSRRLFPNAFLYLDTNCNFGPKRAEQIADCGLSEIRLALDGVSQENYAKYRESGDFAKAFAFSKRLAEEVRSRGSSTHLVWKYIVFRHNDTDEEIRRAVQMAAEIGVDLQFDATYGELASKRPMGEIRAIAGSGVTTKSTIDHAAVGAERPEIDMYDKKTELGFLAGLMSRLQRVGSAGTGSR